MTGKAMWSILSLVVGIISAVLFSPLYSTRLGWPAWVIFILIFLDVALVLYAPLQLREYYAAMKLKQMGPPWNNMYSTSLQASISLKFLNVIQNCIPVADTN